MLALGLAALLIGTGAGYTFSLLTSQTTVVGNTLTTAAQFGCSAGPNTVVAVADTWVGQDKTASNAGTGTTLPVNSDQKDVKARRSFVRFDLPAVPANCHLASAQLKLYTTTGTAGVSLQVWLAAAYWDESTTMTWATMPGTTGTASAATSVASGQTVTWSVTAQVAAMYGGAPNYGFVVKVADETASSSQNTFASRESTSPPDPPSLTITWG